MLSANRPFALKISNCSCHGRCWQLQDRGSKNNKTYWRLWWWVIQKLQCCQQYFYNWFIPSTYFDTSDPLKRGINIFQPLSMEMEYTLPHKLRTQTDTLVQMVAVCEQCSWPMWSLVLTVKGVEGWRLLPSEVDWSCMIVWWIKSTRLPCLWYSKMQVPILLI